MTKGRFTDTGFVAGATPETPPAKAVQPPGTLPILGGHTGSNRAAKELTGDCETDCVDGCAYPGRFSECSLGDAMPNSAAEDQPGFQYEIDADEEAYRATRNREAEALDLLRRLREWDSMQTEADGPYWIREIDKVLGDG